MRNRDLTEKEWRLVRRWNAGEKRPEDLEGFARKMGRLLSPVGTLRARSVTRRLALAIVEACWGAEENGKATD